MISFMSRVFMFADGAIHPFISLLLNSRPDAAGQALTMRSKGLCEEMSMQMAGAQKFYAITVEVI
jgi:hypothetical protein